MIVANKNSTLNRLRSYSSVFSTTSFHKLLINNDYSFIDAKIQRYDLQNLGTTLNTYLDYIQYIYGELQQQYQNEYIYKNTFINELLIEKYGVKDTVAINEFRVGSSIADIVLFNGTSKAFEIKTELDSSKRLDGQLTDYTKIFRECYIITHESLCDKYLRSQEHIGVIKFHKRSDGSVTMDEVRPAVKSKHIDSDTLIRSVRTQEYHSIVKQYYGELPTMNSFTQFKVCSELMRTIPSENLHDLFIKELKKRKSNTNIIPSFSHELRQILFALNISSKVYKELEIKLSKPIEL